MSPIQVLQMQAFNSIVKKKKKKLFSPCYLSWPQANVLFSSAHGLSEMLFFEHIHCLQGYSSVGVTIFCSIALQMLAALFV